MGNWARAKELLLGSVLGNDGKLSSRKATAFWFVLLATINVISIIWLCYALLLRAIALTEYSIRVIQELNSLLYLLLGMILLLFGIITAGSFMNLKAANPQPQTTVIENAENAQVNVNEQQKPNKPDDE